MARSRLAGQLRSRSGKVSGRSPLHRPAVRGSPWSQMCFRVTKTSGRGAPPDPRTTFRAPQAGRPTWSRPPEARPEPDGVAAARDHRVPSLRGDAEQPGGQPVGERVLRRLEAALDTLPGRIACLGATRGGGGGGAQTRPAPNPPQALGLPGRSQPRPSEPCGPDRPDSEAQDRFAQQLPSPRRCARLGRRGAHRHPLSISRACTAMTHGARGAQIIGRGLPRGGPSAMCRRVASAPAGRRARSVLSR